MRFVFLVAILVGSAVVQPASAQERLPPLVMKGLQALQEQRCRDAFDIWTGDWQWPRDTERRQELMSTCDFLQEVGAALHGYDVYEVVVVTPHLKRIYMCSATSGTRCSSWCQPTRRWTTSGV